MAEKLLAGEAREAFDESLVASGERTEASLQIALSKAASRIFRKNALGIQKKFLRYEIKKSRDMGVRRLGTRLNQMFNQLVEFPPENDVAATGIPDDEKVGCLLRSFPKNWQIKMAENPAFDSALATYQEVLDYANDLSLLKT